MLARPPDESLDDAEPLIEILDGFGAHYGREVGEAILWRLGVRPGGPEQDRNLVQAVEAALRKTDAPIERFFFDAFGGALPEHYGQQWGQVRAALADYQPRSSRAHPYWSGEPCSMLIDEVETIWASIAEADDWRAFAAKVESIRLMGEALA